MASMQKRCFKRSSRHRGLGTSEEAFTTWVAQVCATPGLQPETIFEAVVQTSELAELPHFIDQATATMAGAMENIWGTVLAAQASQLDNALPSRLNALAQSIIDAELGGQYAGSDRLCTIYREAIGATLSAYIPLLRRAASLPHGRDPGPIQLPESVPPPGEGKPTMDEETPAQAITRWRKALMSAPDHEVYDRLPKLWEALDLEGDDGPLAEIIPAFLRAWRTDDSSRYFEKLLQDIDPDLVYPQELHDGERVIAEVRRTTPAWMMDQSWTYEQFEALKARAPGEAALTGPGAKNALREMLRFGESMRLVHAVWMAKEFCDQLVKALLGRFTEGQEANLDFEHWLPILSKPFFDSMRPWQHSFPLWRIAWMKLLNDERGEAYGLIGGHRPSDLSPQKDAVKLEEALPEAP